MQAGSQRPAAAGEPLPGILIISAVGTGAPGAQLLSAAVWGALEAMSGEPLLPMEASRGQQAWRSTFFCFCITLLKPSFRAWPRPARACDTDGPLCLQPSPSGPKRCSEHMTRRKQNPSSAQSQFKGVPRSPCPEGLCPLLS